jgi:hypothetical protein
VKLAASFFILAVLLDFGPAAAGRTHESVQVPPTFRAGIDLLRFDVQVVAAAGTLGPQLTASQFEVKIAGRARPIVMIEFLHVDGGPVTRGHGPPSVDQAMREVCVFGFERVSNRAHGHYVVSVESIARDKNRIERPRIKSLDRNLSVRRFSWRSRIAPAASTSAGTRE